MDLKTGKAADEELMNDSNRLELLAANTVLYLKALFDSSDDPALRGASVANCWSPPLLESEPPSQGVGGFRDIFAPT